MLQPVLAFQHDKDADEGLLAHIVDDMLLEITGAELDKDKFGEVGNEVLLRNGIASFKAMHVSFVECVQLHAAPGGVLVAESIASASQVSNESDGAIVRKLVSGWTLGGIGILKNN